MVKINKTTTALALTALTLLLIIPPVTSASTTKWNIQVSDIDGNPVTVTYDQILEMPQSHANAVLSCYGNFIAEGDWAGVTLSDLFSAVGYNLSSANSVKFTANDQYVVTIPLSYAARSDVIVAYQRDGVLLPEVLRLVIPESNGDVWISGIVNLSLSSESAAQPSSLDVAPFLQPDAGSLSENKNSDANFQQVQKQTPSPTSTPAPTNTTIQASQDSPQTATTATPTTQDTTEKVTVFPLEFVFAAALVVLLAISGLSLLFYRRKKKPK